MSSQVTEPTTEAQEPADTQEPVGRDAASDKTAGETDADKIARLERDLTAARSEAGKARVNAKQAAADEARNELAQQIGKALGLVKDDQAKVDPAQLAAQLEHTKADARDRAAELIIWRHATTLGVNAAALTDSRAFAAAVAQLDPTSPTFEADVKMAATAAADTNPLLKQAQAAGKSGLDLSGGTGEQSAKPTTLEDAIAAKLGAQS